MRTEDGDEIIEPGTYDVDGRALHVWIVGADTPEPELWACMAHDHGPFCRICQKVDGILNALLVNVLDGRMMCRQGADGQFQFRLTKAGEDAVRHMVNGDES